jgi:hypothetical protein
MPLRGDQGRPVNDLAVGLHLAREPIKAVGLGLDLHPPDMSVDDRDVDPRGAVRQAKLFQNQGVGAELGVSQQAPKRRCPEIRIPQPLWHDPV